MAQYSSLFLIIWSWYLPCHSKCKWWLMHHFFTDPLKWFIIIETELGTGRKFIDVFRIIFPIVDINYRMNMVRHNYKFIQDNIFPGFANFLQQDAGSVAGFRKTHDAILNGSKLAFHVQHTNGYEVRVGWTVIEIL